MRLRHRTVRGPRQGGGRQAGRQGASGSRGRQQKATGRPHRAARPPPGFAIAADAWACDTSDEELEASEGEEQGEDDPDLLLQLGDASEGQQQQQQPAGTPAPPASTQRPAPSSEERWLTEMALSPLLSLPQLSPEAEAAGAWAAPSATPAALPAATPGLVAGVERSATAALPSPAFHDFGGPSLPPRQPLWRSHSAAPPTNSTPAATAAAAAGPVSGLASVGAGRTLGRRVSSDGSGRAGLAAATAAVAREAALSAAGGGATSPPIHPWDLRRPASGPSALSLHDVRRLQLPPAPTPPAKVAVPAGAANPQPYHLFASGAAVPFEIPHAQFGLPRKPQPFVKAPAGSTAQLPQPSRMAPPASEAAAVAAVEAAFAAVAVEPSPRSAFTATHYSAGSSLAARHTHHTPLSDGMGAAQPLERSQRSRRQRELSEEFHWSDEEEGEEQGGSGSETETEEEDEDMMLDSEDSDEESSASAAPSSTGRSRSGRRQGGRGGSLQQSVQHAAMAKRIKQLLHLAAPEAAAVMGLSTGKFRQLCRAVGIARWPSRRPRAASESDE